MSDLLEQKSELRQQALARRDAQQYREVLSQAILERFLGLAAYQRARTVMLYIGVRSEVHTRPYVPGILASGRRVVVPYCEGPELGLFELHDLDELELCPFGLWEPPAARRDEAERRVDACELDLIGVPGLAFDRRGARLGHGKAYYDRLLQRVRPDAVRVGLAFDCQLFTEIPMGSRDVFMDYVITERKVYQR
jgi:5-formyltetrahydrofolate cyclo-ligase